MKRRAALHALLALLFTGFTHFALAKPLAPQDVPEPLQPWVHWVLDNPQFGVNNLACPFLYNNHGDRRCAWPATLTLNLDEGSGQFQTRWQIYTDSLVPLPGDWQSWPQNVTANGTAVSVLDQGGRPMLKLAAGTYDISGMFVWPRLPEALAMPAQLGIVALTVKGNSITFPEFRDDGKLWLRARDTGTVAQGETDRLDIRVYRHILDDLPMQVTTQLELNVAGKQREVLLDGALLTDFIPLALNSSLPARLEPDGKLRLQVRPGQWRVNVTARHAQERTELTAPASGSPMPAEELWSFAAQNHLRLVEVQAATAIDPRQTTLPPEWHDLPAYRLQSGESLRFEVIRRGDPQPEPNKLSLHRNLWLDFDGKGYTFNDLITGTMTSGWRLETAAALELGRVTIDDQPQLITRGTNNSSGVEVRRGSVNLNADGRQPAAGALPASGWAHDFQSLHTTLNLPPGWRVFTVSGADSAQEVDGEEYGQAAGWFEKWSLLDMFIMLLLVIAVRYLWDLPSALLALATLVLIWKEPGAPPHLIWLHILVAITLLRVLPLTMPRLRRMVTWYRAAVLLVLIASVVPFLVQQVRQGLYPQLERPWQVIGDVASVTAPPAAAPAPMPAEADSATAPEVAGAMTEEMRADVQSSLDQVLDKAEDAVSRKRAMLGGKKSDAYHYLAQSANLYEVDPKANVQTGPGLPQWNWRQVQIRWSGPVTVDQNLTITLLSPAMLLLLNTLRVILLSVLVAALIKNCLPRVSTAGARSAVSGLVLAGLAMLLTGGSPPVNAEDDFPPPTMLEELNQRLRAAADCLPGCAQVPRLRVTVADNTLHLRAEYHAQENVAVPLPGGAAHWLPSEVLVDGTPASGLLRNHDGLLWLDLTAGVHTLQISGALPGAPSVQIPLPLTPRQVELGGTDDWEVSGVREDGTADPQLVLTRIASDSIAASGDKLEPSQLPGFARVERTLRLGLNWQVETRVRRASNTDSAIVIELPLLAGESVTTDNLTIENGKVKINLPANSTEMIFHSLLQPAHELKLTAPDTPEWVEIWRLDASPVLHVEASGIAVVHHQTTEGTWLPEWRPWPSEQVTLTIARPEGISGNTFTIDRSQLIYAPGKRATDVSLNLQVRSSQGGQHALKLPEGALLQSALINGAAQPIRQQGSTVTLPLTPGKQDVQLNWREPQGIHARYVSSAVDLGVSSVNSRITVNVPEDRWILFTGGPRLGPAVLIWGFMIVLAIIAAGLSRVPFVPLSASGWFLLALGLTQVDIGAAMLVVVTLIALGARGQMQTAALTKTQFNLLQLVLIFLLFSAAGILFSAIQQGLLGDADMQIAGNGSNARELHWYQDHAAALLPQVTITSAWDKTYNFLMLAWAAWLAITLVRGLIPWTWRMLAQGGLWRAFRLFGNTASAKKDTPASG